MPYRYIVAEDCRASSIRVNSTVILNVAASSYYDLRTVAAEDCMEKNSGILSDRDVSEDHRLFYNICRRCNFCIFHIFMPPLCYDSILRLIFFH